MTWTFNEENKLIISGNGDMSNFSENSTKQWRSFKDEIFYVVIEEGITNIGEYAFADCANLHYIQIPSSITNIKKNAFLNCDGLYNINYNSSNRQWISININTGNNSIFKAAIKYQGTNNDFQESGTWNNLNWEIDVLDEKCSLTISGIGDMDNFSESTGDAWRKYKSYITSVTIKDEDTENNITSISDYAFAECFQLKEIHIPISVTSIGTSAFRSCNSLTEINFPEHLKVLGSSAFYDCDKLTKILLPEELPIIDEFTFVDCNNITFVRIPISVIQIKDWAFLRCTKLTTVQYEGTYLDWNAIEINYRKNPELYDVKVKVDEDFSELDKWGNLRWLIKTTIQINDTLEIKGQGDMEHFSQYAEDAWRKYKKNITTIKIFPGVTSISNNAFFDFVNLNQIIIPDTVTNIGYCAFYNCENLTNIEIPDSVTFIGGAAFAYCNNLTEIIIPPEIEIIYEYTFQSCKNLTTVTMSENIEKILSCAFADCDILNTVHYNGTNIQWFAIDVHECNEVLFNIPIEFTETIEQLLDAGVWNNLRWALVTTLTGKLNLTIYKNGLMYDFPWKSYNTWRQYKHNIISAVIQDGVQNISEHAFRDCLNLTNIDISEDVTVIGNYAFYNCNKLTDIYYDESKDEWDKISIENNNNQLTDTNITINYNNRNILKKVKNNKYQVYKNEEPVTITGFIKYNNNLYYAINGIYINNDIPEGEEQYSIIIDPYNPYLFAYYCNNNGKVQKNFTGFIDYNNKQYYVYKGLIDFSFDGVITYNNKKYLLIAGYKATDETGLIQDPSTGIWYYIIDGEVSNATNLTVYDNQWYYIKNGIFAESYAGLIKYNDKYYYIINGVFDENFTGLGKHNNKYYYIVNGIFDSSYTGLLYYHNKYYYIKKGIFKKEFTGLIKYDDKWHYILNGMFDVDYIGYIQYNNQEYYIMNGIVFSYDEQSENIPEEEDDEPTPHVPESQYTGLMYYNEQWHYINNGVFDPTYTGFVEYQREYFYVIKGIVTDYTGLVRYNNEGYIIAVGRLLQEVNGLIQDPNTKIWYYVKKGKVDTSYHSLAMYNDHWFYVKNGIINTNFTGIVHYDNEDFYVINGQVAINFNGIIQDGKNKYMIAAGRVLRETTGLVQDPRTRVWYYIIRGKVSNATTLVIYDNHWFRVENGVLNTNFTGIVHYDNEDFYITNGMLTEYSGIITYNSKLYMIAAGRVLKEKIGLIQDPNTQLWWYIVNGIVDTTFTGLVEYNNNLFYVIDGKLSQYTGQLEYNDEKYQLVNGQVISQYI